MKNKEPEYGKLPPQAIDLEEAVLGALLMDKEAFEDVHGILITSDFYKEVNQIVFESVLNLHEKESSIDILTVVENLKSRGKLDQIGGPMYVAQLTNRVASSANIEFHARIIKQNSIKRKLIQIASDTIKNAYDDTVDVFDGLGYIESSMNALLQEIAVGRVESANDVFRQIVKDWDTRKELKTTITGVPSGFKDLDILTGGFGEGNMIVLAGRPGMGKTTFALQMAQNATKYGKKVGFITLEMSPKELTSKIVSAYSKVDYKRILKQYPSESEYQSISSGIHGSFDGTVNSIFFIDKPSLTDIDFKIECRKLVKEKKVDMIIVDYLQLMQTNDKKGVREQEISTISRAIKSTAKHLNIPIMALSQLSRSVEQRGGDKRPMLSDLRESGAIEQDADMVIFAYRAEYYNIEQDSDGNSTIGTAELIIEKNRGGSTGIAVLDCDLRYSIIKDKGIDNETTIEVEYNRPLVSKEFTKEAPF
jgi:replicative DNA helicase